MGDVHVAATHREERVIELREGDGFLLIVFDICPRLKHIEVAVCEIVEVNGCRIERVFEGDGEQLSRARFAIRSFLCVGGHFIVIDDKVC